MKKLLLLLSFIASGASASSLDDAPIAMDVFLRETLGTTEPSRRIPVVGFSTGPSVFGDGVLIFFASTPEDITSFHYNCQDSSGGRKCVLGEVASRCFYFARVGQYSTVDLLNAMEFIRNDVSASLGIPSSSKFWQHGDYLFSELIFIQGSTPTTKYYACERSAADETKLVCAETLESNGDAP